MVGHCAYLCWYLWRAIEITRSVVEDACWNSQGIQNSVIKLSRCLKVIGTDHYVTEHDFPNLFVEIRC